MGVVLCTGVLYPGIVQCDWICSVYVSFSNVVLWHLPKHLLLAKKKAAHKQKNINREETWYSVFRLEKHLVSYVTLQ